MLCLKRGGVIHSTLMRCRLQGWRVAQRPRSVGLWHKPCFGPSVEAISYAGNPVNRHPGTKGELHFAPCLL